MDELTLARYEVQGNDFLIALLTESQLSAVDKSLRSLDTPGLTRNDMARVVCDRHLGVGSQPGYVHSTGADGFIVGVHKSTDGERVERIRMHLLNADGSFAETSGNGLACLAHAALDEGLVEPDAVQFETGAGLQTCHISESAVTRGSRAGADVREAGRHVGVEFPPVADSPAIPAELVRRIERDLRDDLVRFGTGDVGNPHLVIALRGPIDATRTARFGAAYGRFFPDSINVEFIWLERNESSRDELAMAVWERGAGLTHSCGTGSVVAATLARRWAIVPDKDVVNMNTVPQNWEFGTSTDYGGQFSYRVHTDPPPRLRVVAERVEDGLTLRLDHIPALLDDLAAMTESKR